jgi:Flp pilus assembly protein TadG
VELVIIVPGLIMILGLLLAGSRIWLSRAVADDAAYSAARAASLARSPGAAQSDGVSQGLAALDRRGLDCRDRRVSVDTSGFAVAVGTPATITASVTCDVDLSDLLVPGLPGSMRLTGSGAAALDTYRAR